MTTFRTSRRKRRVARPLLFGAGGIALVAAIGVIVVTGADYTDHGQFNYLVTAEGTAAPTPPPTTAPPTPPPSTGNGVPSQNFSNRHSLVQSKGVLYGWGGGSTAGTGTPANVPLPVVVPSGTTFSEVAAGPSHNLAIDRNGDIWGWGNGFQGALGPAGNTGVPTPIKITSGATKFRKVAAGGYINIGNGSVNTGTSFAIDTNGNLWSWGSWNGGMATTFTVLGDGSRTSRSTPTQITSGIDFIDVAAGWEKNAAVTRDGFVYTWGSSHYASLALSDTYSTSAVATPTRSPYLTNIVKVAFGGRTAYALDRNGYAWVWGNKSATMGASTLGGASASACKWSTASDQTTALAAVCVPARVPRGSNPGYTDISAGESNVYVLDTAGAIWSWGGNRFGNTGDGTLGSIANRDTLVPTKAIFPVGTRIEAVVAAYYGGVAVDTSGAIWAWGRVGETGTNLLGDGRSTWGATDGQLTPKKVK